MNRTDCARQLLWIAEHEVSGRSPLYERLCRDMATDNALLDLVRRTPENQPVPNLFLAAVRYLLLTGHNFQLAKQYRLAAGSQSDAKRLVESFRAFCLAHATEIEHLLLARRVQTNEVGRCAYLLPALHLVARDIAPSEIVLIDVGTSAGLNLLLDRYQCCYGSAGSLGAADSTVRLHCDWRGHQPLPNPYSPLIVNRRIGIDLHIVNVSQHAEVLWLRSLLWPEESEREPTMLAAIRESQQHSVELHSGNALDLLPELIRGAASSSTTCVMHCHVLNQFSLEERAEFRRLMARESRDRPLVELSAEWIGTAQPELRRIDWRDGNSREEVLANVDQHGRWVEWLLSEIKKPLPDESSSGF